jgi:hypothetical protein
MIALLAGLLCAAFPAGAQQPAGERGSQTHHAHGDGNDARSMLRLTAVHQVRYRAEHGRYASSLQELGLDSSRTVAVRITANGADGFAAVSASDTQECVIFSGRIASPRSYAPRPDEVACRPRT